MNYRHLFEQLAKRNLPESIDIGFGCLVSTGMPDIDTVSVSDYRPEVNTTYHAVATNPWECRNALMLIVDALEATGEWRFSRHRDAKGMVKCALTVYSVLRPMPFVATSVDDATAMATVLIAVCGSPLGGAW